MATDNEMNDDLLDQLSKHLPSKLLDRVNEALAARQPGAQEPGSSADGDLLGELDEAAEHGSSLSVTYLRELAKRSASALRSADPVVSAHAANLQGGLDAAERISGLLRQQLADAAPPAQGIDLGQSIPRGMVLVQIADAERLCSIGESFGQHFDMLPVKRVRALIDQRDAAPGVQS